MVIINFEEGSCDGDPEPRRGGIIVAQHCDSDPEPRRGDIIVAQQGSCFSGTKEIFEINLCCQ